MDISKSRVLLVAMSLILVHSAGTSYAADSQHAPDEIVWYRADFPPVTIPFGTDAERGFFDQVMNFVIKGLADYKHNFHTANFKRIMSEIKNGENVCCPSLYKTEAREEFVSFSLPAMVVLPNGIIINEKNLLKIAPYVNENGQISLSELLLDTDLILGISNGRIYSNGIDEIIEQHSGKNIYTRSGDDVFQGLMSMLYLGRVDYIIGYPTEAGYFSKKQKQYKDYMFFPIAENKIPFTLGYVGCPKTEWGQEVIQRIDAVLKEHRHTDEFLGFYESWLDDSTKKLHRSIATEYFEANMQ